MPRLAGFWLALALLAAPSWATQKRAPGDAAKPPIAPLPAPARGLVPGPNALPSGAKIEAPAAAPKPEAIPSAAPTAQPSPVPSASAGADDEEGEPSTAPRVNFDGAPGDPVNLAAAVFADPAAAGSVPLSVRKYQVLRYIERPLFWALMRPKIYGRENIPDAPAEFLFNHASFGPDPLNVIHGADRPMRFMIKRAVYEAQPIKARLRAGAPLWERPFLAFMAAVVPKLYRQLGAVPIAKQDPPEIKEASLELLRQALRDGQSVAVFPEGVITRSGTLGGFRGGFARVAQGVPGTPIVPGFMDGLWGRKLSRRYLPKGSYLKDLLPRRVRVFYGQPLTEVTPQAARQAVSELSALAMEARVREERSPLAYELARRAKRRRTQRAVVDSSGADLTYGAFAAEAAALSVRLAEKLEGAPRVGLLLPTSAESALANAALAGAGKVIVNLDAASAAAAATAAGVNVVLTTRAHLASLRAGGVALPNAAFLFIEDERAAIPEASKKRRELALRLLPSRLWARLFFAAPSRDMDEDAAVLFTSGSGGAPEAVVLSHLNVLAAVEMAREVLPGARADTVLGLLPFSNPFGFATTLWMPLLSGMSAAYHDGQDAAGVGALAESAAATLLFSTPRLLARYAASVPKEAFASLRLAVGGGEKLHPAQAEDFQARFGLKPIEAYGTTEAAGLVTVGVPEPGPPGGPAFVDEIPGAVGRNLPGSAARVVDAKTGAVLSEGAVGVLQIKGPHVMKAYLDKPEKTAEAVKDGWYTTSDLAFMSRDGKLTIVGPKARFSMIDGEVVSHVAVEERLRLAAAASGAEFAVTSVKDASGRERLVALYAGWTGDAAALRAAAVAAGLRESAVPALADIRSVPAIPLTSSGRLDLRALNALASQQ